MKVKGLKNESIKHNMAFSWSGIINTKLKENIEKDDFRHKNKSNDCLDIRLSGSFESKK
jgi:hypothetical protein